MEISRGIATVVLGGAALALAACSGGSPDLASEAASNPTGTPAGKAELSVALMDAPVDDVEEVHVEITRLTLKPEGDGPAFDLAMETSPITVDLLELTEENAAILVDSASIESGDYEWLSMDVNATIDGVTDSYVVTDTGAWEEIFVPSGRVRLVSGFEVEAGEALMLIFDWDLRKGLVHPPGLGGYILKPAFRVISADSLGRISGTIDLGVVTLADNDCNADSDTDDFDVGNSVYIFEGLDVVPDDVDEEGDVTPLATVDAVLNDDATRYEYSTIVPFGDYTVALTCQSANDLAESNETGNEDPADDTVGFVGPAVNVTLSSEPGESSAIVDFDIDP
jgi:hypothetical protein